MDMAPGCHGNGDTPTVTTVSSQSTISRFACRIVCQRAPPYTARIYAAGFDSSKSIFLGEKAAKWWCADSQMDGLTTNGVLVMRPRHGFTCESKPGAWREISVCGNVFTLRETRSAQKPGKLVEDECQELTDGTLIDLCGATLLWRSAEGLSLAPTLKHLEVLRRELNAARPQCPVGLRTLAFPSLDRSLIGSTQDAQPWAYLHCGHVHGYHGWRGRRGGRKEGSTEEEDDESEAKEEPEQEPLGEGERECPLCRTRGLYVPLKLGRESGFYLDGAPPTHAFNPCGHVCSERTAAFWSKLLLPHGAHGFYPACPFCMRPLARVTKVVRLIFQGPLD